MDLPQVILTMILQHHERLDGLGYSNRLKGEKIILESRILAVADVVEARTSHRPYRPALGIDAALHEIKAGRDVKYDARVVDTCIALFRKEDFSFIYDIYFMVELFVVIFLMRVFLFKYHRRVNIWNNTSFHTAIIVFQDCTFWFRGKNNPKLVCITG